MARLYGFEGTPNLVVIGVPGEHALLEASEQCRLWEIPHHVWREPDWPGRPATAICTAAICHPQRQAFAEYQILIDPWPSGQAADSKPVNVSSTLTGSTNMPR